MKRMMQNFKRGSMVFGVAVLLVLNVSGAPVFAGAVAVAADEPNDELQQWMAELEHKMVAVSAEMREVGNAAEKWQAEGHERKVAELRVRFDELGDELAGLMGQMKRGQERLEMQKLEQRHRAEDEGGSNRHAELMNQLEVGMRALRELGREEELKMLQRVAREVQAEMRGDREGENKERGGEKEAAANREMEIAHLQVRTLEIAAEVMRKAEKPEAVQALERALYPRQLRLEVGYSEKVAALLKKSPGREDILHLLGMATEWAQELGMHDRAEHLAKMRRELWARPKKEEQQRERAEAHRTVQNKEVTPEMRELVERQMHTLELARRVFDEYEKPDALDITKRALQSRRTVLAERHDVEAQEIRRGSPPEEQVLELLNWAVKVASEHENREMAVAIEKGREAHWGGGRAHRAEGERERAGRQERQQHERRVAEHHLEIMASAMPALREAGRADTAELLERAMHARKMDLAGREDRESMEIREASPGLGAEVEILGYAARLWRDEFDNAGKAEPIEELTRHLRQRWEAERERRQEREHAEEQERRRRRDGGPETERKLVNQIEEMHLRMREMEEAIHHLNRQLEEMRERDRR